jgi:hypothetical protein
MKYHEPFLVLKNLILPLSFTKKFNVHTHLHSKLLIFFSQNITNKNMLITSSLFGGVFKKKWIKYNEIN